MSVYKRGKFYWYKFMWRGKLIQESTRQGNAQVARNQAAAHRTRLSNREVGIREKKPAPTLAEFVPRFLPWVKATTAEKTWRDHYGAGCGALLRYKPIAKLPLDQITSERAADFAAWRRAQGIEVSSVNTTLRVLRRILRVAGDWELLNSAPKIKQLPGERHREHVVTPEEEARYLAAAPEPLGSVATVLVDSGMRPEECYRLRWEFITWANGRHGTLLVTHGKSAAARRVLPLTARVRVLVESRWDRAGKPPEGWVWPAPTRSGHVEPSSLKKQHARTLRLSGVRPFVLYSLRHTFLTRLGESGCDAWTLARIAGHSSIAMSSRYVHPSETAVLSAVEKLGVGTKLDTMPKLEDGAARSKGMLSA
jgi:integrase